MTFCGLQVLLLLLKIHLHLHLTQPLTVTPAPLSRHTPASHSLDFLSLANQQQDPSSPANQGQNQRTTAEQGLMGTASPSTGRQRTMKLTGCGRKYAHVSALAEPAQTTVIRLSLIQPAVQILLATVA